MWRLVRAACLAVGGRLGPAQVTRASRVTGGQVFVTKLRWITTTVFLELLALAQCLPGPTSTQVSFALGVVQKGITGGLLSGKRRSMLSLVQVLWASLRRLHYRKAQPAATLKPGSTSMLT